MVTICLHSDPCILAIQLNYRQLLEQNGFSTTNIYMVLIL